MPMKVFGFILKLAFICNLLFLGCLIFQRIPAFKGVEGVNELVIILGWLISPFLNLFICIWFGLLLIRKKKITVPGWLLTSIFLFLIFQIFVHFILPV